MKNTKTLLKLLFVLAVFTQNAKGQVNAKGIRDPAVKGCGSCGMTGKLSVSSGLGSGKNNNGNSQNTIGFGLDYFYPIKITNNFSWGLNGGGNYFSGKGDPFAGTLPVPYQVTGQLTNVVSGSGDSKSSGYFVGVGPQLNFAFADRFVFSPIFQVGYLGVTHSDFKATQTTLISGGPIPNYTKTYDLISQTKTKTSGLGFIPKARLTYMISKTIGVWAEASYMLGPTTKNNVTTFKPQSDPTLPPPSLYTIQQMTAGTYTTVSNDRKFNDQWSGSFGVTMSIGGSSERGASSPSGNKGQ